MQTQNEKQKTLLRGRFGIVLAILILGFFFGLSGKAEAANHYIKEGAIGTADGSDWTNAWTDLPATFVRGDTYYVADGSYGSHTIPSTSGTSTIVIKKATAGDHGTDTGWSSNYGDGQADFAQPISIQTSYVTWDGVVGDGSDSNSRGFRVNAPLSSVCSQTDAAGRYQTMVIGTYGTSYSNITVSHTAFQGCGSLVQTDQARLISSNPTALDTVTITYNYFTDAANSILMRHWSNGEIAYNYFNNNYSGTGSYEHGQQISAGTSSNMLLHDNIFKLVFDSMK